MDEIYCFTSHTKRKNKLKYQGNMEIVEFEQNGETKSFKKSSYIKTDKLFHFDKNKLDYYVFGRISDDLLDELMKLILLLEKENKLTIITDNLQPN